MAKSGVKKELTPGRFASFLSWLDPDSHEGGDEYERLRFRLTTFFSSRKCRFPEDLADETINRVALKIEEEEIENKMAYCYGVAKFVFLESLRKEKEHENVDEIQLKAKDDELEEDGANPCLEKCLKELGAEKRKLVLEYFSKTGQAKIDLHRRMSERLEISKTALRMKIMRIKKNLKACMVECMTG